MVAGSVDPFVFGTWYFYFPVLDAFHQWWALFGKTGDRETRLYFLIYYNTYLPSWLLALLLREIVVRRGPEDPSCNSLLYTLPSVETVLLAQYYVQGLVHHLHFRLPLTWQMGARAIIVNVFTIGMLWWSGQYRSPRSIFWSRNRSCARTVFRFPHIRRVGAALPAVCRFSDVEQVVLL